MQRLFISDLHLAEVASPQFQTLSRLLQVESKRVDEIYILGDLCEVWVGDDDDAPFAAALRDIIREASNNSRVAFVHGNRDFLIGAQFARQCRLELLGDPQPIDPQTVVAHGDQFCIDDNDYQQARRTLRSHAWQADILKQPLAQRRALAANLREQSIAAGANKPANIMDVNVVEVARVMTESGRKRLIHGHTHRPGVHAEAWGKRYVLGDWEHCGWLLREAEASEPQLECFALAGHYGT